MSYSFTHPVRAHGVYLTEPQLIASAARFIDAGELPAAGTYLRSVLFDRLKEFCRLVDVEPRKRNTTLKGWVNCLHNRGKIDKRYQAQLVEAWRVGQLAAHNRGVSLAEIEAMRTAVFSLVAKVAEHGGRNHEA